jgi:Kef-type K+ transport system membrane component KefB
MDLSTHPVLIVMEIAVAAPLLVEIPRGFRLPTVVLEMALGIVVGPQVLGRTVAQRLSPHASASLGGKRSNSSSAWRIWRRRG